MNKTTLTKRLIRYTVLLVVITKDLTSKSMFQRSGICNTYLTIGTTIKTSDRYRMLFMVFFSASNPNKKAIQLNCAQIINNV